MFLLGQRPFEAHFSARLRHCQGDVSSKSWTLPSLCFFLVMDLAKPMFLRGHGPCQAYVSSRPWTLPSPPVFLLDTQSPCQAYVFTGHKESLPSLCVYWTQTESLPSLWLCWTRRVLVKPMFHLLSHGFCQVYVDKCKTYHVKNRLL